MICTCLTGAGTTKEHFAKIAWKNHKHSVNNPYGAVAVPPLVTPH
jgi:sterol carrier protein 2